MSWLLVAGSLLLSLLVVPLFVNLWLRSTAADVGVEPLLLKLFKRYGPIVTLRMGSRIAIFVADRRLAHAALVGAGAVTMANCPQSATNSLLGISDNIITRVDCGPVWRLLRRNMVAETLHPSRVRQFTPARAWVRGVLMDKLRAGSGAEPGNVMEAFRYAMFSLLVLMCFGERLDKPAVRAIEHAERAWLLYVYQKMSVFFFPSVTRHIFRARLQTTRFRLRPNTESSEEARSTRRRGASPSGRPQPQGACSAAVLRLLRGRGRADGGRERAARALAALHGANPYQRAAHPPARARAQPARGRVAADGDGGELGLPCPCACTPWGPDADAGLTRSLCRLQRNEPG